MSVAKRMSAGELRARVYLSLRRDPVGFPLAWLRKQAEENGHNAVKLVASITRTGKAEIVYNERTRMRWVHPGPLLH